MLFQRGKWLILSLKSRETNPKLADDSKEVPKLKKKSYFEFKLSQEDWTKIELMHKVLHVSHR